VSLQSQAWPEPDPEVSRAIRSMYRGKRNPPLPVQVRDRLGELFPDAEFATSFAVRGKPGWSPGRLAMITVLQMAGDFTDRQAADEVRQNLAWKYCLGLALDDPGFDASVLSEFRSRVVAHQLEEKVLDLLLNRLKDLELVGSGGKQRTDSTHVISAVRDLNRLELAGESVRAALEALSAAAPHWVDTVLDVPDWSRRYAARIDSWRLPTSQAKRDELAWAYGKDGFTLLTAVYASTSPAWLRELPAVQILRIVLLQNYTRTVSSNGKQVIKQRESRDKGGDGLPPGESRVTSPYDIDTRWSAKRETTWVGYKIHITETCTAEDLPQPEPGTVVPPNLITNVATTHAAVPDAAMTTPIHHQLADRALLPGEHYLDSGYPSAELMVTSKDAFGITLVTPLVADRSPQARANNGFDTGSFAVDFDRQRAVCPQGQQSATWNPSSRGDREWIVVSFSTTVCGPCPVRPQCTTAKSGRRQLSIRPRALHEASSAARAQQNTKAWQDKYALRAGVEGAIHQAVAVTDLRHARYRGLAKTHLEHVYSAVGLNLIRLNSWWNEHPMERRRTGQLARLELALAN
jgi:transposase